MGKTVGEMLQQTSEETVDGVGKQRAWGDQKRRNTAINKKRKKKAEVQSLEAL